MNVVIPLPYMRERELEHQMDSNQQQSVLSHILRVTTKSQDFLIGKAYRPYPMPVKTYTRPERLLSTLRPPRM